MLETIDLIRNISTPSVRVSYVSFMFHKTSLNINLAGIISCTFVYLVLFWSHTV